MNRQEKFIHRWLGFCMVMVLIMIGIGGFTRLTGSGLSIVEWKPIVGIIPPLSEASWLQKFELYKRFPEYELINSSISLSDFKFIYFVEYFHRFWGRSMGFVLLVPTIYAFFKLRRVLPGLAVVWLLAIAQAGMGWYMVKSGLIEDPMVSPFRLTGHLLLAIAILSALTYNMNKLNQNILSDASLRPYPALSLFMLMIIMTIIYGGLTAGNHAGLIYNSFPDMHGDWVPVELLFYKPWWIDLTTNPASIQFIHRILATLTTIMGVSLYLSSWKLEIDKDIRLVLLISAGLVSLQYGLGIMTLLLQVPIFLGVIHQVTACVLFSLVSWCFWRLRLSHKAMFNPISRQYI